MKRLRRVVACARKSPLGAFAGVAVLPVLHVLLRAGRLNAAEMILAIDARYEASIGPDLAEATAIADAVFVGARIWRLHEVSCVARSMCTWSVLRRQGGKADIVIGFDPTTRRAHAWVELDGMPVDDTPDVRTRYQRFDRNLSDSR